MGDSNFIDYVKIFCSSGKGGAGSAHLYRARGVPKGGPDGGDGGRGGHIILEGSSQLWTLLHLKYKKHNKAHPGSGGSRNRQDHQCGRSFRFWHPTPYSGRFWRNPACRSPAWSNYRRRGLR